MVEEAEVIKGVKRSLVFLDLDTVVLNASSGELFEGLVSFISDLKEKNILVAVFSVESSASIDALLQETGLDIYFPQDRRYSYADLLTQEEIFAFPDPSFFQYCLQMMNTFDRTICITGSNDAATVFKSFHEKKEDGMEDPAVITILPKGNCASEECPTCVAHDYVGLAQGIAGVLYWWDRNDTHPMYIPHPTKEPSRSSVKPRP